MLEIRNSLSAKLSAKTLSHPDKLDNCTQKLKRTNLDTRLTSLSQYNDIYLLNLSLSTTTINIPQLYLISFLNSGNTNIEATFRIILGLLRCSKTADTLGVRNVRIFSLGKYFHINYNIAWLIIHINIHCTWSTTHFTIITGKKHSSLIEIAHSNM